MVDSRTVWRPAALASDRPAYVALADAIARDLVRRTLTPGDRLPTHRALAAELGVTVRTVARGYAEAERRGLVSGEVGRGTYVRDGFGLAASAPSLVDLAALHPPIAAGPAPGEHLADTLTALAGDPLAMQVVTDTEGSADLPAHRAAAADWIAHGDFAPTSDDVLLTAGAQHALSLCLGTLVRDGTAVATTSRSNPGLLAAARALGTPVVPVATDADGMVPEALAAACADGTVSAVHLQPTFSNPTARTLPRQRREQLAAVADEHGLWVLEDDPLAPLRPDRPTPLAALLPERTCHVASAAKVLALGLRVGILAAPPAALPQLAAALRASTWLTSPLLGEVLTRWVRGGTASDILERRASACAARQRRARSALAGLEVRGDTGAPHLWLELPSPWSTGSFVAAARDAGILVAPGDDFVVDRTDPAFGVRLGLNAEVSEDALDAALRTLARIVAAGPASA